MRLVAFPAPKDPTDSKDPREPRARTKDAPKGAVLPLEVERLSYAAGGQRLVREVSFHIQAGERTVVLGYNGAGKSLLLRLCHGLLRPDGGRIVWKGEKGNDAAAVRRAQAMVFQKPVLLRRTVHDNMAYVLRARGLRGAALREQVMAALARCGIAHLAARPARALSGGEQQKLALARAWAVQPEVLFLDEPTASLDPAATLEVERIIDDMFSSGTTIVFSTHDMAQARRMADRVLFIHRGELLEDAQAASFFHQPRTSQARDFLSGRLCP